MPVFARRRQSRRSPAVIDFLRHDKALPDFITFTRADAAPCATRRRVHGSVGPSRTNLLAYSQDFSNWSKSGTSVTTDAGQAPDGTATADAVVTGGAAYVMNASAPVVSAGGTYTASVYVKDTTTIIMRYSRADAAERVEQSVNLSNGVITPGASSGGTYIGGTITPAANGWYRCTITGRLNSTTNAGLYITSFAAGTLLWGAQLEVGSTATPYIPTTTAPVTTTDWPRTNFIPVQQSQDARSGYTNDVGVGITVERDVDAILPNGQPGKVTRYACAAGVPQLRFGSIPGGTAGTPYVGSAFVRLVSGADTVTADVNDIGISAAVLTPEWQRISRSATHPTENYRFFDIAFSGASTIEVCMVQIEEDQLGTGEPTAWFEGTTNTPPYGDLEVLAANAPRIEYNVDGTARGLLIEPSRKNLLPAGHDKDFTLWYQPSGTVQMDVAPAPDGTMTACLFTPGTLGAAPNVNGTPENRTFIDLTDHPSGPHSNSIWVKTYAVDTEAAIYVLDPVTDAVEGSKQVTTTDQWQRITASGTTFDNGPSTGCRILFASSQPCLIALAQSEPTLAATSHVVASLTRAAESATITDLASINWNPNGWTGYVEWEQESLPASHWSVPLSFQDGSGVDALQLYISSVGSLSVKIWNNSVTSDHLIGAAAAGVVHRLAFAMRADGMTVSLNGGAPVFVVAPIRTNLLTRASFGGYFGVAANCLRGYLRRFKGWDRVLSAGELQALTMA